MSTTGLAQCMIWFVFVIIKINIQMPNVLTVVRTPVRGVVGRTKHCSRGEMWRRSREPAALRLRHGAAAPSSGMGIVDHVGVVHGRSLSATHLIPLSESGSPPPRPRGSGLVIAGRPRQPRSIRRALDSSRVSHTGRQILAAKRRSTNRSSHSTVYAFL